MMYKKDRGYTVNTKYKKALKIGCISLLLLPVVIILAVIGFFSVPVIIDNIACARFEKSWSEHISLPDGVKILDTASLCANTSGTGDHTEMIVLILVESDGNTDPAEIEIAAGSDFVMLPYDSSKKMFVTKPLGEMFKGQPDADNRYVLITSRDAPMSHYDIRGM